MSGEGTVAERTAALLSSLSAAERRVGRALLADYPSAALGSAARLAARAEVSAPTVLRFAQTLGYDGFTDLQVALRAELSAQSTGPINRLASAPAEGTALDRVLRQGHEQAECALASLAAVPERSLELAVELLADVDRRLLLHGGRFSHLLAEHLAAHLEQLRPGVRVLGDPAGADLGLIVDLDRHDVLVLFDYDRYQLSASALAATARNAGTTVLLVTDDLSCPVAPDAAVVLAAASTTDSTFQSMTGGFLLTELLIPLVMDAIGEPARTRMALWEQHRAGELLR